MGAPLSAPGWYPDPERPGQQRYYDGTTWTEHRAPAAPPPKESASSKTKFLIVAALLAIILIVSLNDKKDDEKSTANTSPTTYTPYRSTAAAAVPSPTPVGPVKPEGVTFHQEGTVASAEFQIGDALFMGLTRIGAQSQTKQALEWALREYPNSTRVFVQGRFPTKDAYGNEENSVVLNVGYDRATLDKINFENIDTDKIWVIRDSGFVHPELQG